MNKFKNLLFLQMKTKSETWLSATSTHATRKRQISLCLSWVVARVNSTTITLTASSAHHRVCTVSLAHTTPVLGIGNARGCIDSITWCAAHTSAVFQRKVEVTWKDWLYWFNRATILYRYITIEEILYNIYLRVYLRSTLLFSIYFEIP